MKRAILAGLLLVASIVMPVSAAPISVGVTVRALTTPDINVGEAYLVSLTNLPLGEYSWACVGVTRDVVWQECQETTGSTSADIIVRAREAGVFQHSVRFMPNINKGAWKTVAKFDVEVLP